MSEGVSERLPIENYDRPLDALAHRLWTHWSQHIADEEEISKERLERWKGLWVPFSELPESAKETDRRLVERFCEEEPNYEISDIANTGNERDLHG